MADTSWRDIGMEFVKQLPQTLTAAGIVAGVVYRWITKMRKDAAEDRRKRDEKLEQLQEKSNRIEKKVNGNHQQAMRAIYAQGQLKGIRAGKKIVHEDIAQATAAIAKATKRGQRRSTDK